MASGHILRSAIDRQPPRPSCHQHPWYRDEGQTSPVHRLVSQPRFFSAMAPIFGIIIICIAVTMVGIAWCAQ
jgi:hypothetical protein